MNQQRWRSLTYTCSASGLGIGTTPAALVAHGVDTTVVEIDPVVHEFASKYFRLPANHTAVIQDAVTYTSDLANNTDTQFDYIVHDVFTGGAEPIALFTLEFLQNLNALLKPNGVIAIVRYLSPLVTGNQNAPPQAHRLTRTHLSRTTQATSPSRRPR